MVRCGRQFNRWGDRGRSAALGRPASPLASLIADNPSLPWSGFKPQVPGVNETQPAMARYVFALRPIEASENTFRMARDDATTGPHRQPGGMAHRSPGTRGMTDSITVDLAGRRVLVVEDEALVSMLLEDMLEDLGCEVLGPLMRVGDALAYVADSGSRIDVAILDVNSWPASAASASPRRCAAPERRWCSHRPAMTIRGIDEGLARDRPIPAQALPGQPAARERCGRRCARPRGSSWHLLARDGLETDLTLRLAL